MGKGNVLESDSKGSLAIFHNPVVPLVNKIFIRTSLIQLHFSKHISYEHLLLPCNSDK